MEEEGWEEGRAQGANLGQSQTGHSPCTVGMVKKGQGGDWRHAT